MRLPSVPAWVSCTASCVCRAETLTLPATCSTLAMNWTMAEATVSVAPWRSSPLLAISWVVADICSAEAESSVAPLATEIEAWLTSLMVSRRLRNVVFRDSASTPISSRESTWASTVKSPVATLPSTSMNPRMGRVMLRVMTRPRAAAASTATSPAIEMITMLRVILDSAWAIA